MKQINRKSPKLLYLQLKDILLQEIKAGKMFSDETLLREKDLQEIYQVSRNTVRRAVWELIKAGFLKRVKGKGIFIISRSPKIVRDSKQIGLIILDVEDEFFSKISRGVEDIAHKREYSVILCNSDNETQKEKVYLHNLKNRVAGFIIAPATGNQNHAYYGDLLQKKIPFVFIDRYLPEFNVDYVVSDNAEGGYLATQHLLNLGYQRIALISDPECTSTRDREEGYRKALKEYGVKTDKSLIKRSGLRNFEAGYHHTKKLLQLKSLPEAIFALNDEIARGSLEAVKEAKMQIPKDIALVGYDNLSLSFHLEVPLTTVNQSKYEMGAKAAELLIDRIEKKKNKIQQVVLDTNLVIRNSTVKKLKIMT